MLRTRSPVYSPLRVFSLDLHVLGTPPAFVLSQDQTLQLNSIGASAPGLTSLRTSLKALRYPQSASWTCYPVFKDRAPAAPLRTTNCPAPPRDGGALPTAVRAFVSRASSSALAHAPFLRGALHVTPRSEGVKNCQEPSFKTPSPAGEPSAARADSSMRRGPRQTR